MRLGGAVAIALLTVSSPPLASPSQVVPPRQLPLTTPPAVVDEWAFEKSLIAPGVSLLVGLISLGWNWRNERAMQRFATATRRSARKTSALTQYRSDALVVLKELRIITNELTAIPRSADYNSVFRPIQDRFVVTARKLRNTLEMISYDPEVEGGDWGICVAANYDHFLDCSNTLLAPQTTDQDHMLARTRLGAISTELLSDVLKRFSRGMDAAQS